MATFILGAIITNIAGSMGGTTLKRNGSTRVIMNKPTGSAYSRLLSNRALSYLSSIFKSWTNLPSAEKLAWNDVALLYMFPDKFGNLRNLTGRQLYIKLNTQRYLVNPTPISASEVTSEVPVFEITDFIYTEHDQQLNVSTTNAPTLDGTYLYMVEISLQPLRSPTYIAREIIFTYTDSASFTVNLTNAILKKYPFWNSSYNTRVYVSTMNSAGYRSIMLARDMVVAP